MTLELNRKRRDGTGPGMKSLSRGRFGLSREKEAVGAVRGVPLAMGFECRFLSERSGKAGFDGVCEWVFRASSKQDWSPHWSTKANKKDDSGVQTHRWRHAAKQRAASRKWFHAMSCQDAPPENFGSGGFGLR